MPNRTRPAALRPPARLEHLEPRVHLSVARPSYNTGTGFFVSGGQVYDANGEPFVIRGVNQNHWWGNATENFNAIDHVAKTGSNAVRAVFNKDLPGISTQSGSDTPAERRAIVEEILSNNMVPIVEDHAVTNSTYVNDPNGLHQLVTNWLDPANVSWLQQYERSVILNIANEWGPPASSTNTVWRDSYVTQVQRLRSANVDNLIMIDAGGWGQDINTIRLHAQAVLDADPQHNIVFSIHFYSQWRTEDRSFDVGGSTYDVNTQLTAVKNAGLPIVVGEFSWESLSSAPYRTRRVLEICEQLDLGYMGWGWNHNSPAGLNMLVDNPATGTVEYQYNSNTDLTAWGDLTVNDPDVGIKATSVRATIFPPEAPRLILEKTSVVVPETGQAVARVRLSKAPAANVTVALSKPSGGDANLALAGSAFLTFTPANWSEYQTILVSASVDADTAGGTARFQLASTGLTTVDFLARELDSGIPAGTFTLTPTHDRDTQSDVAAGTNATVSASRFNLMYMKYDLSGVGGRVASAVLRVYKTQTTSNITGRAWLSLDDNWTQSTAPASLPALSYPVLSRVMPSGVGYVDFDVTGLVNGEVLGDRTATIGVSTNSNNWTNFHTKEAAAGLRPQLIVTSTAAVPAWLAPGSAALWDAGTKALTVTGAAAITADPGADAPVITANGTASVLTINPSSGRAVRVGGLTLTGGATARLTSVPAAAAATAVPIDSSTGTAVRSGGGKLTGKASAKSISLATAPVSALRTAADSRVLVVNGNTFDIDANSTLDLADNNLILNYSGNSPAASVEGMVKAGFNGGDWLGKRITSSAANASRNFALGVSDNSRLAIPFSSTRLFAGEAVDTTSVLVKFTHRVDLDLDGVITSNDATIFNGNYSDGGVARWGIGDWDFDGFFTSNDATLFNSYYDETLGAV